MSELKSTMRCLFRSFGAAVLTCGCLTGCQSLSVESSNLRPSPFANSQNRSESLLSTGQSKSIEFQGVSFTASIPSVSEIEASIEPGLELSGANDKPDSVRSRYVSLRLKGKYASQHQESFFKPKIEIYKVSEFRNSLFRSKPLTEIFDQKVRTLVELIDKKPSSVADIPFLRFLEGSPLVIAHLQYVSFEGGRGVFYLTQMNIENSLINNQGLTFIFQGFTDDNAYYVLATFPETTDFLPSTFKDYKYKGYELPEFFLDPKNQALNEAEFERYKTEILRDLEATPSSQFDPDLRSVTGSIKSLSVSNQLFQASE